jgi:predicted transcriptional regulator
MRGRREIVIRSVEKPDFKRGRPDALIRWFCEAFGLSTEKGDELEEEILKDFIYAAFRDSGLSSSEIKLDRPTPRSTVVYHLNRFVDMGIVVKRGRKYYLRATDMSRVVEELEYDMNREMMKMLDMAKELDSIMHESLVRRRNLQKRED